MAQIPTAKCSTCGKRHPANELELSFFRPDPVVAIPRKERKKRATETDDFCDIELKRFFVRGVIPLNVEGRDRPYRIGAWVELDKKSFKRVIALWRDPDQGKQPPFSGQLVNAIPSLPNTCGIKIKLQLTNERSRPDILVAEKTHPLFREQSTGITDHRAHEYTELSRTAV